MNHTYLFKCEETFFLNKRYYLDDNQIEVFISSIKKLKGNNNQKLTGNNNNKLVLRCWNGNFL